MDSDASKLFLISKYRVHTGYGPLLGTWREQVTSNHVRRHHPSIMGLSGCRQHVLASVPLYLLFDYYHISLIYLSARPLYRRACLHSDSVASRFYPSTAATAASMGPPLAARCLPSFTSSLRASFSSSLSVLRSTPPSTSSNRHTIDSEPAWLSSSTWTRKTNLQWTAD